MKVVIKLFINPLFSLLNCPNSALPQSASASLQKLFNEFANWLLISGLSAVKSKQSTDKRRSSVILYIVISNVFLIVFLSLTAGLHIVLTDTIVVYREAFIIWISHMPFLYPENTVNIVGRGPKTKQFLRATTELPYQTLEYGGLGSPWHFLYFCSWRKVDNGSKSYCP